MEISIDIVGVFCIATCLIFSVACLIACVGNARRVVDFWFVGMCTIATLFSVATIWELADRVIQ